LLPIPAKEVTFAFDHLEHWIRRSSIELDKTITIRDFFSNNEDTVQVFSFFENASAPNEITDYFKKLKDHHIFYLANSKAGIVAGMRCKASPLDNAIKKITNDTFSRLWLKSQPSDEGVYLIIECPWDIDIEKNARITFDNFKLKISHDPIIKEIAMHVPVPTDISYMGSQIDELDKRIGRTLLMDGYYATPRPKGIDQKSLAEKLGISKPTLEDRMRKIEAIGLTQLLDIRGFTETEVEASWKVLQNKIKATK